MDTPSPNEVREKAIKAVKQLVREKGWPIAFQRIILAGLPPVMEQVQREYINEEAAINVQSGAYLLVAHIVREIIQSTVAPGMREREKSRFMAWLEKSLEVDDDADTQPTHAAPLAKQ